MAATEDDEVRVVDVGGVDLEVNSVSLDLEEAFCPASPVESGNFSEIVT